MAVIFTKVGSQNSLFNSFLLDIKNPQKFTKIYQKDIKYYYIWQVYFEINSKN